MNAQQIISIASGFISLSVLIYVNDKNISMGINIMDVYLSFIAVMSFLTLVGFKRIPDEKSINQFKTSVTALEFVPRIGIFTYFIYIWNIPMFLVTILHFFILWKLFEDFIWNKEEETIPVLEKK